MSADIRVYCDPRLKHLAGEAADRAAIPLSELVVRAIVKYIHAPAALAIIPRKSMGRPRKEFMPNGKHPVAS